MGTVADKLGRLQETKHAIRAALEEKGQAVADGDSFASYAEKIGSIERGGGGAGTPPDPAKVYKETRPADWLPMPEPQDDEMYLLFHIPDGVSALIAFTVTCTGSYTVKTGTVRNGAFVSQASTSVASGSNWETELSAKSYENLTADGMKQVMIKVSGSNIATWAASNHSKASSNLKDWNIVEIACRLPSGLKVDCGGQYLYIALTKLRYFTWVGTNIVTDMVSMFKNCCVLTAVPQLDTSSVTNMSYMFNGCSSLMAVPQLDTSSVTNMSYMFGGCPRLTAIPQLDTSIVTNMASMFLNCHSLTAIPQLDTSKVTTMQNMFSHCSSLTAIPQLDTSSVTNMGYMFSYCHSLTKIPQLDTSKVITMKEMFSSCYSLTAILRLDTSIVTNMASMFQSCTSLSKLKLKPDVAGWVGVAISLSGCVLGRTALVDFFNSLPTITSTKAITLTRNPGISELMSAEKMIATRKGWTLTL